MNRCLASISVGAAISVAVCLSACAPPAPAPTTTAADGGAAGMRRTSWGEPAIEGTRELVEYPFKFSTWVRSGETTPPPRRCRTCSGAESLNF